MFKDSLYKSVHKKWEEITVLPPQTLGPLTPAYKLLVPYLKTHPMRILLVLSVIVATVLYFVFGPYLVSLTSLLQKGI